MDSAYKLSKSWEAMIAGLAIALALLLCPTLAFAEDEAALGNLVLSDEVQLQLYASENSDTLVSSVTGVDLGSGILACTNQTVDQVDVYNKALAAVIQWRQDALNDTRIKFKADQHYVTVREYLGYIGMSEQEYLSPQWSNNLEKIALQRSIESMDSSIGHTRPNDDSCFTAEINGYGSSGEVLAWGVNDIAQAINLWASEKDDYIKEVQGESAGETGHYTFLIRPQNKYYGFGQCKSGVDFGTSFAGESNSYLGGTSDPTKMKGSYSFEVTLSEDKFSTYGAGMMFEGFDRSAFYLCRGENVRLVIYLGYMATSNNYTYCLTGDWSSSDPSVASIDLNGWISAKKVGKTTLGLTAGSLSWSGAPLNVLARLSGEGRYDTMSAISTEGFADGSCKTAILATGANFPDALAASSLAGVYQAPVLLTESNTLTAATKAELRRLGVEKLFILGGESSVSGAVMTEIESMGISVERIAGLSRQETAVKVFASVIEQNSSCDTVIIAAGKNFPDTLSVSPYAYAYKTPIILTDNDGNLTNQAINIIKGTPSIKHVIIVGGENSVSNSVQSQLGADYTYKRLSGANRYETSAAIATWEVSQGMSAQTVALATGEKFPDALAGAALCGAKNGLLLLVDSGRTDTAASVLSENRNNVGACYIFGGLSSVPDAVVGTCVNALLEE